MFHHEFFYLFLFYVDLSVYKKIKIVKISPAMVLAIERDGTLVKR